MADRTSDAAAAQLVRCGRESISLMAAALVVILTALIVGLVLSVVMAWAGNRSITRNMALAALVLGGIALLLGLPVIWSHLMG